jgi:hypothetical protein
VGARADTAVWLWQDGDIWCNKKLFS